MSGILSLALFCLVRLSRLSERSNASEFPRHCLVKRTRVLACLPRFVRDVAVVSFYCLRGRCGGRKVPGDETAEIYFHCVISWRKKQQFLRRPPPRENKCLFWIRARGWINTSELSSAPLGCILFFVLPERCRPH